MITPAKPSPINSNARPYPQEGRPIGAFDQTEGEGEMTGPRPAGRRWTLTDDDMPRKLLTSGMEQRLIAQKLKRSIGAIQSRIYLFKKPRKRRERGRPAEPP
jgi:hypothetical protein